MEDKELGSDAFMIACEKLQSMVQEMPNGKKVVGEIHRCTEFQKVIDVISRNRADLTMIISDRVEDNLNLLVQIKEMIANGQEVTIGVFSYKDL